MSIKTAVNDNPFKDWHDVNTPEEISLSEFALRCGVHQNEVYNMPVPAKYVGILHGAIKSASMHPGVQSLNIETLIAMNEFIEWCNIVFSQWGISPEKIAWLNKRYVPAVPADGQVLS